jgi:hypothetical protein
LKSTSFTPDSFPQSFLSIPDLYCPSEIRTFRCYESTAHKLRPSPFGTHLQSLESIILLSEPNKGEHNRPSDSENGEHGGRLPPIPVGAAGGQVPWQHMQPQQPPMQPPQQQQRFAYPPLPPSQPSSCSSSRLSYMNPSPRITSRDPTPLRYQTDPPEHRDPSPWRDTYVCPPPPKLWQPWDDWTPYQRWAYGRATDEDNDLRLTDPDTFWPDMLIGD